MEIERGIVPPELRFTSPTLLIGTIPPENTESNQSTPQFSHKRNVIIGTVILVVACIYWKYKNDAKKKRLKQTNGGALSLGIYEMKEESLEESSFISSE